MAKNTNLPNKRIAVKHVRDKAKAAYQKLANCYVCNSEEDLELHHLHSITILLNNWAHRKGYDISTDEGILEVRDEFIAEHRVEIYDMVYTLCNKHHISLHSIYGKAPSPSSVDKQRKWLDIQKAKIDGTFVEVAPEDKPKGLGVFSKFY